MHADILPACSDRVQLGQPSLFSNNSHQHSRSYLSPGKWGLQLEGFCFIDLSSTDLRHIVSHHIRERKLLFRGLSHLFPLSGCYIPLWKVQRGLLSDPAFSLELREAHQRWPRTHSIKLIERGYCSQLGSYPSVRV